MSSYSDLDGLITDPVLIAERLLTNYIMSYPEQSAYLDVVGLNSRIMLNDPPTTVASNVEKDLSELLFSTLPSAIASVRSTKESKNSIVAKYAIRITISVRGVARAIDVGREINVEEQNITAIARISRTGETVRYPTIDVRKLY